MKSKLVKKDELENPFFEASERDDVDYYDWVDKLHKKMYAHPIALAVTTDEEIWLGEASKNLGRCDCCGIERDSIKRFEFYDVE